MNLLWFANSSDFFEALNSDAMFTAALQNAEAQTLAGRRWTELVTSA
jgi:hypothetical protein